MADKSQTHAALDLLVTYGRVRFHQIAHLLAQGISGRTADEFNVSRERCQ